MISLIQLGTIDYATGQALQQKLVALRKEEKIGDVLLLLEHKPVITLGRNAKAANVIASPELLSQRGVELFECDRGGDVTFHGPGQLVGYPIFDLRAFRLGADPLVRPEESKTRPVTFLRRHIGVIEFVRRLEEVLIRTCADFAITSKRVQGLTGVWTDPFSGTNHVGTAAPGRSVERSSTAAAEGSTDSGIEHDREGHDFSRAANSPDGEPALAAKGRASRQPRSQTRRYRRPHLPPRHFPRLRPQRKHRPQLLQPHHPLRHHSKPVTSMQQELGKPLDLNAVAESISRNFGVSSSQILWVETLDALLGNTVGVPMKPPAELRQLHKEDDPNWA